MNDTYYISAVELSSAIHFYESDLNQASEQNNITLNDVNDFLSSSVPNLIGGVWNNIRNNIQDYSGFLVSSEHINGIINETNKRCLETILDFLEPDKDLNTADLPKYEAEKTQIEKDIADLKTENNILAQVPKIIKVQIGKNIFGTPIYEEQHNPAYDEAQAKIAANNNKIDNELTPALNETNRIINKINTFNEFILPSIMDRLDNVENDLNNFINKIDNIIKSLPNDIDYRRNLDATIRDIDELDKQYDDIRKGNYDNVSSAALFLYTYDKFIEHGFSEWGAKAALAQMYGTTHGRLDPTKMQSNSEGKICGPAFGISQLEWRDYEYEENGKIYHQYGCGEADEALAWCIAHEKDFYSIDGQVAYLAEEGLRVKGEKNDIPNLDEAFKNATEEDYMKLVQNYGTVIQGTQGSPTKNQDRAEDGDMIYSFWPLIETRNLFNTTLPDNITTKL